ncbi:MAG: DNA repair protein RadC [Salibacteraceae bacterium]
MGKIVPRGGIKAWAEDDRPREKLLKLGPKALTNAELIAILIGSGSQAETAVDLSRRIFKTFENQLHRLGKLKVADLTKFKGIGTAKAVTMVAALELGRRRSLEVGSPQKQFTQTYHFIDEMKPMLQDLPHEEFWALYLNQRNCLIRKVQVGQGGWTSTAVDQRVIMQHALELKATAFVVFHNHPSGNNRPSLADQRVTQTLFDCGKIMNIRLLDHIIIADNSYYSFHENGFLENLNKSA